MIKTTMTTQSEPIYRQKIPDPVIPGDASELPGRLSVGLQKHRIGSLDEAEVNYRAFIQNNPLNAQALGFLGVIAAQRGNHQSAIHLLTQAIRLDPGLSDAYFCLGHVLCLVGMRSQGLNAHIHAAALCHPYARNTLDSMLDRQAKSEQGQALKSLTEMLAKHGYTQESLNTACDLVQIDPTDQQNWLMFGQCLVALRFSDAISDRAMDTLVQAFLRPDLPYEYMSPAASSALRYAPELGPIFSSKETHSQRVGRLLLEISEGNIGQVTNHPLLMRILEVALVCDHELEAALTVLRHAFLLLLSHETDSKIDMNPHMPFLCSLAKQSFLNEFVFTITPQEQARINQLRGKIKKNLEADRDLPSAWIAILACYEPLYCLDFVSLITSRSWQPCLAAVFIQHITEPAEESRLRDQIPQLTPIEPGVSSVVRSQYEENAFPRWLNVPPLQPPISLINLVRAIFPHMRGAQLNYASKPEILVAGCGTGLIPIIDALQIKGSSVTAVDLSLASLSYALRKTRELGITNIEYGQADILNLGALGREFDHINCFGVLHHLADPVKGWNVLVDLLKPGGTMLIGLYSEKARRCVGIARDLIAEKGYSSSPQDMRSCRQDLMIMARTNRELLPITDSQAFFSMSNFRDYVFHVQEHCLTIPQLKTMIDTLHLEFLGFELQNSAIAAHYRSRFPQDPFMTDLKLWDQFEAANPLMFHGTYRFWVRKPINSENTQGK